MLAAGEAWELEGGCLVMYSDGFITTRMICDNETAGAGTQFVSMPACQWVRNGIAIISALWFSLRS